MERPICEKIIAFTEDYLNGKVQRISMEIDLPALVCVCFEEMRSEDEALADAIGSELISNGADAGVFLDDAEFYALIKEKLRLVKAKR